MASSETHEFLFVKPGDHVVIKNEKPPENTQNGRHEYWIGQVINCIGGARTVSYTHLTLPTKRIV